MFTTNEIAVLKSLKSNYFGGDLGQWIWANCINDSHEPSGIEGKTLSGVVSSLVKKGLVETDGNTGRDACVRLTPKGYEEAGA